MAVVMSPWSGCAAAPVGRRARARSPRCMRFGRACPRGSLASFARTQARLWGALRGPQNPQRWPWSPRSHTSHFAQFASPLTLRANEGTFYGHSRLLAAAGKQTGQSGRRETSGTKANAGDFAAPAMPPKAELAFAQMAPENHMDTRVRTACTLATAPVPGGPQAPPRSPTTAT